MCKFYDEVIIDDIPCFITLKYFNETGRVRLILHNENIQKKLNELVDDDDNEYMYNLLSDCDLLQLGNELDNHNKTKHIMEYLNEVITNIRFCRYNGKFIYRDNLHYKTIHDILPIYFKNNTNIRFENTSNHQCCICMENTLTVSSCNHPVCIPCAMRIVPDYDEDILCPLCRDLLTFI